MKTLFIALIALSAQVSFAATPVYTCLLTVNGIQAGMSGSLVVDDAHLNQGTYLSIIQNQDGLHEDRFSGEVIGAPTGGRSNILLRIRDAGQFTTGILSAVVGKSPLSANYVSNDGQSVALTCTLGSL